MKNNPCNYQTKNTIVMDVTKKKKKFISINKKSRPHWQRNIVFYIRKK